MTAASVAGAERKDVPDKYKWNLADLYPSEAAWTKAKEAIAQAAARAGEASRASRQVAQGAARRRCRRCSTSICELSRLSVYANALSDEDVRAARPREMKQAAEELATAFAAAIFLGAPGDPDAGPRQGAQVDRAGEEARALPRVPGRDAAPQAAHAGRRRGEGRRRGGRDGSAPAARCTACSPTPTCRTRPSSCRRASRCAWTPSAYTLHRQARVRADRDKVFASFFGALKTYERTMGATLAATVKAHLFEKRVRHFDTALAAALFQDNIPVAVYKQLLADVHRSLPTLHRYLALRKRMLGLGRPPLPGPLRAAGRERRHALRARRGARDHARRAGAARQGVHGRAAARGSTAAGPTTCRRRASARARTRPASTACTRISC